MAERKQAYRLMKMEAQCYLKSFFIIASSGFKDNKTSQEMHLVVRFLFLKGSITNLANSRFV
jgi:hypothetical protein